MEVEKKVKKPIEAIQCTNTFSLLQRKMYNVLLANAASNLHAGAIHQVAMGTLCSLMGYRSNDYKTIKNRFRELRRMDIEWDIINENGNKVWTNTSPLSLARVIEGEGLCEYEFTPSLIPYLDRPAQYAKFSLAIQAKFKSNYGLALYENCERYRKIGHTRTFDIPTFRKLMGVEPGKYLEFFALKRRVVVKATDEVNQYADFEVEPEYQKRGRNIVSIRFLIQNKKTELLDAESDSLIQLSKSELLVNRIKKFFGLSEKEIAKHLKNYGDKYLNEKVEAILSSDSFNKGLIKNMAGYLKKALDDDYQPNMPSKLSAVKKQRENTSIVLLKQEKNDLISQLQREYNNYLSVNIKEIVDSSISEKDKQHLVKEFKLYISKTVYSGLYEKEGLGNIIISDKFVEFIRGHYKELLQKVISFSGYVQKNHVDTGEKISYLNETIKNSAMDG